MRLSHLFAACALALSLAAAPALVAAQTPATVAATPAFAASHVQLDAPDGRKIDVSVWQAADERGVIVFSHGFNGNPESYSRLLPEWVARGFTVVAPLHVDSLRHPDHAAFSNEQAFATRIMDLAVVRGFVRATHSGKPMVAAGHSFGSLLSLIEAGAVTVAGPLGDPDIKAVVALSSPGDIPGVVLPETYAGLRTPVLMVTGDADLVPGWVTDPRAHRSPFDRSVAGDKMLMTFVGGDHSLVRNADDADFQLIAGATSDFMEAYALGDAEARARINALTAPDGVTIERR